MCTLQRTSTKSPSIIDEPGLCIISGDQLLGARRGPVRTHPPLSHMPHGSSLRCPAPAVKEPFSFSKPQKKSVLLGCPARSTGMFPAQLRGRGNVTFGKGPLTWKSAEISKISSSQRICGEGMTEMTRPYILATLDCSLLWADQATHEGTRHQAAPPERPPALN